MNPFPISQTALVHYDACARRFWLRYGERLHWPAPVSAQTRAQEEAMERGRYFHDLVEQSTLGLPVGPRVQHAQDPALQRWWEHFEAYPVDGVPDGTSFSEVTLATRLAGFPLVAQYDRLVVSPAGEAVILDWKTGGRKPEPGTLQAHWQTRLYLFILAEAYPALPLPQPVALTPESLKMVYWFAEFPAAPVWMSYSQKQHEDTRRDLTTVIEALAGKTQRSAFPKTDHRETCAACVYQVYCNRQDAGLEADWETEDESFWLMLGDPLDAETEVHPL